MSTNFDNYTVTLTSPPVGGQSVTPSDSTDLSHVSRGIYIAVAGHLSVVMESGVTLNFDNLAPGVVHAMRVRRVRATGTTATGVVALW